MSKNVKLGRPNNSAALAKRTDFLLSRMGYDPREGVSFRVMSSGVAWPSAGTSLAADPAAALPMINADPRVKEALTADSIHVHTVESSNTNYIPDRYAFLSLSTIANIAADSKAGMSFMTRHATPGMFNPGENPYGRTFAGLFEQSGDFARSVTQFYMLKSFTPNGPGAASTDDLHRGMMAGTLFDFSPGLKRGASSKKLCDICSKEIFSLQCGHCPGSVYGMTDAEIEAQVARGIPDGVATYTFVDWRGGELSLVSDGAIDGVGTAFSTARRAVINLAADSADICACCGEGGCDCSSNENGSCSCAADCQGCKDQSCDGMTAMASHQEEPMFTAEQKIALGLAATATDAEAMAKVMENQAKLVTLGSENESLKLAQKTKADADFAAAWSEKLGPETFAQIKDLPNRDALAAAFAAQLAAAAKPGEPAPKPPIGDPLAGTGLSAAPNTAAGEGATPESEFVRRSMRTFATNADLEKKALTGPINALAKCLAGRKPGDADFSENPPVLFPSEAAQQIEAATLAQRKQIFWIK